MKFIKARTQSAQFKIQREMIYSRNLGGRLSILDSAELKARNEL